jgi:hypothetical protein
MFKSITMLAGAAVGVYVAVATGAPAPAALISHFSGMSSLVSQLPGSSGSSGCSDHWGTGSKTDTRSEGPSTAKVDNVRAGQHSCYDRLVIDLGSGARPGYKVRYVPAVHAQGSGNPIPLRGRANLEITVTDNAAAGFPASSSELANVSGFRTFRQVAGAGSFEGYTELGVGLRGKRPFRVRVLNGPGRDSRLVIDVAHHR